MELPPLPFTRPGSAGSWLSSGADSGSSTLALPPAGATSDSARPPQAETTKGKLNKQNVYRFFIRLIPRKKVAHGITVTLPAAITLGKQFPSVWAMPPADSRSGLHQLPRPQSQLSHRPSLDLSRSRCLAFARGAPNDCGDAQKPNDWGAGIRKKRSHFPLRTPAPRKRIYKVQNSVTPRATPRNTSRGA